MNAARTLGTAAITLGIGVLLVLALVSRSGDKPKATTPATNHAGAAPVDVPAAGASLVGVGQLATSGDCVSHVDMYDRIIPTIANEARLATAVVVGTVASISEPRWNTGDGARPAAEEITGRSVYRIAVLNLSAVAKGGTATSIAVRMPGGRVGCEQFSPDGIPLDVRAGDRLALFVQALPARDMKGVALPTAVAAWPVTEASAVITPADGEVAVDVFVTRAVGAQ